MRAPARAILISKSTSVAYMQRHSTALFAAILRSNGSAVGRGTMHSVRALHTLPSLASWANSQQPMLVQKLCAEAVRAQLKQAPCAANIHRGFAAQAHVRPQIRSQQPRQRKIDPSGTQGLYLVAFTVAMIGVTYASVPLYRMFCQATGYGGTVQQGSTGMRCAQPDALLEPIALSIKGDPCRILRHT